MSKITTIIIVMIVLIVACSPSTEEEQSPVLSAVEQPAVTKEVKSTQPPLGPEATPAETEETEGLGVGKTALPGQSVPPPPAGHIYHAIYPGEAIADSKPPPEDGIPFEEDGLTLDDLRSYEQHVGKTATWVYFSHNWFRERSFPLSTASWIRDAGSIPYIRLMLRSSSEQNVAEPTFTLDRIINGDFDDDLRVWARGARDFGSPLIAEYGTEANGEWFSWNGVWNGGGTQDGYGDPSEYDGPERFRDAYRHIIQIARDEGASNITWVFHANGEDIPDDEWNRLEEYYPGDEWVDWLGVSVYGALDPMDDEWPQFREGMDAVYPRLAALSPDKPIVLLEFGVAAGNPLGDQAEWAEAALTDLVALRWPRLIGFSWWNEHWENDDDPSHDTTIRVQDNPDLAAVFQRLVGNEPKVLGHVSQSATSITEQVAPVTETNVTATSDDDWWQPEVDTTWQWQLSEQPIDRSYDVDMYDIDLFDNEASVITALHNQGRKVVCYISVGSWEEWRPDADQFPASVIGNDYGGWPGEKWLDIRQLDLLASIMRARLDECQTKGFDGIEPDNIDGYTNDTGFPLTYEDQLNYNIWLANEAHARGLSIGLKNDPDQVDDLLPYFDWALTEDCFVEDWCEEMLPFIATGKPVFAAEYTDTDITTGQFCPQAEEMGFSAILKNRDLEAYREACR